METDSKTPTVSDPVSDALAQFKMMASMTPGAFADKVRHIPKTRRSGMAAILIDVLRATSTVGAICAAGSHGVSLAVKPRKGDYDLTPPFGNAGDWVFGGEENGNAIPGGAIGNSPLDVKHENFTGKYVKFFSTNGAKASDMVEETGIGAIYLANLANLQVTASHTVRAGFDSFWIVCGGFYGSSTIEDTVCAGRVTQALLNGRHLDHDALDDEARMSVLVAQKYDGANVQLVEDLRHSQVGVLLERLGHGADIEAVVSGKGLQKDLWYQMTNTVVVARKISGMSIYTPELVENLAGRIRNRLELLPIPDRNGRPEEAEVPGVPPSRVETGGESVPGAGCARG